MPRAERVRSLREPSCDSAGDRTPPAVPLIALIFFVAIAAANTLVMTTSARRTEFTLLRRIGATRRQLTSMVAVESLLVIVTAVVIGTLAVLIAAIAMGVPARLASRVRA